MAKAKAKVIVQAVEQSVIDILRRAAEAGTVYQTEADKLRDQMAVLATGQTVTRLERFVEAGLAWKKATGANRCPDMKKATAQHYATTACDDAKMPTTGPDGETYALRTKFVGEASAIMRCADWLETAEALATHDAEQRKAAELTVRERYTSILKIMRQHLKHVDGKKPEVTKETITADTLAEKAEKDASEKTSAQVRAAKTTREKAAILVAAMLVDYDTTAVVAAILAAPAKEPAAVEAPAPAKEPAAVEAPAAVAAPAVDTETALRAMIERMDRDRAEILALVAASKK